MAKKLTVDLDDTTFAALMALSEKTRRVESDLLEEALAFLFAEYKELMAGGAEDLETFGPGSKGVSEG